MQIEVLKSKLHCVTVTEANLNYMGSIPIDIRLLHLLLLHGRMLLERLDAKKHVRDKENNLTEVLSDYFLKSYLSSIL